MKLNNTEFKNLSECFSSVLNAEDFVLVIFDWNKLSYDVRVRILDSVGFDEDSEELAKDYCTAAVIVWRNNTFIDFNNCQLHISTVGYLPDVEVFQYIKECFLRSEIDFENMVELNIMERFHVLSEIIPSIDMREVK